MCNKNIIYKYPLHYIIVVIINYRYIFGYQLLYPYYRLYSTNPKQGTWFITFSITLVYVGETYKLQTIHIFSFRYSNTIVFLLFVFYFYHGSIVIQQSTTLLFQN